jgi:MoaA/NifB/PqqE/SkfB family radical SAM enzyme
MWMAEVTNRCNLACPMCTRETVSFIQQDMDLGFIKRLIDDNPRLESIWPYGFGESLMHPHIFEVIRYARQKGIVVSLSTNGTLLTPENTGQLLRSGLDYLILAIDGATARTYERYRYGARFERVIANVERLLELKNRFNAAIHITVQMIQMQGNAHEIDRFKSMWRRKGVNRVRVRQDLTRKRSPSHADGAHRPCFFLWRGPAFIQAAGTLLPCPYYHGSEPFGDLKSQSMAEAWNSEKMVRLRQAHVSGDLSAFPVCAQCPRYQPNTLVASGSFFVTTGSVRRWLPIMEDVQRWTGVTLFE